MGKSKKRDDFTSSPDTETGVNASKKRILSDSERITKKADVKKLKLEKHNANDNLIDAPKETKEERRARKALKKKRKDKEIVIQNDETTANETYNTENLLGQKPVIRLETKEERQARKALKKRRKLEKQENPTKDIEKIGDKSGVTLLLFYAYVEPEWTTEEHNDAIEWAESNSKKFKIGGRLRVAKEGFNGTMTGSYDGIRSFCNEMREWKPEIFGSTDFKFTDNLPDGQLFPGPLKIMRIAELVNYGLKGKQPPLKLGGTHLPAKEYHEKMKEPNTVIIDVRNSYEADIGRFNPPEGGAKYIDPEMRVSTEFPEWVDKNKKELEGKNIMMYCTGGIRCERASALLRQKGLDNIYQMQGGIHRYLEEFNDDGGFWIGKNYTFDKRFAHGAKNAEVISKCNGCQKPWDKYHGKKRCPACKVPLLICDDCQKNDIIGVCLLCQKQGLTPKMKVQKPKIKGNSCGVCEEIFKSRNELFRHLTDSGHHNRKSKK